MVDIDDGTNLIAWWREKLEKRGDWNSLPKESRKRLLGTFQRCVKELVNLDINAKELTRLIQLTNVPTVFEAVLSMIALLDVEKKTKWQALAYLTRVVLNSEKGKLQVEPTWQKEISPPKRRGEKVTLDYIRKYNPYNFKKRYRCCYVCTNRIRIDNVTGVCSKCQKKGRNGR